MFFKNFLFVKIILLFMFLLGGFFVFLNSIRAAGSQDVLINEVAWMGTESSSSDEWLELKNCAGSQIDLTGWTLTAQDGSPSIDLSGLVSAGEYFLLERTDDSSAPDAPADLIYTGALNNSGEILQLKDSQGNLVDEIDAGEGWPAGDNSGKLTMERTESGLWKNSQSAGGTPRAENSGSGGEEDTTPPEDVTELAAEASDSLVDLSWTASASDDVSGYKLYIDSGLGYGSGEDLGNIVSHRVVDLQNDTTYTFKITAYDGSFNESEGTTVEATPSAGQEQDLNNIVINEFVPDPVSGGDEWIEFFNKGQDGISLENWTIEDGVSTLHTFSDETITPQGYLVFELSSSRLNNSGDIIVLKSQEGEIIDQVSYGGWDDGNTDDNAPSVSDPDSLIRYPNGQDSDMDNSDWQITNTLTKGEANLLNGEDEDEEDEEDDEEEYEESEEEEEIKFYPSDVVVNEFVSDPADGDVEWVELYNNKDIDINLQNWTLEEGSEAVNSLEGEIVSEGFFVFEKPKGNLNNNGDVIILRYKGSIIDKVTYGQWDDGQMSDNAPSAEDPYSVARIEDGRDTNNDFGDFQLTTTSTKSQSNILTSEEEEQGQKDDEFDYSDEIIINEFLPNPEGKDNEGEFVELKSLGQTEVDLKGWKLGDNSSKIYTIEKEDLENTKIEPGGFLVLERQISGLALNNSGTEKVKLYQPDESLADEVQYSGKAEEDYSYSRDQEGGWFWTAEITKGEENIIETPNEAPEAVINAPNEVLAGEEIIFDASDSVDPENDELSFYWDLGDGNTSLLINPSHVYRTAGTYEVNLTVIDSADNQSSAQLIVSVLNNSPESERQEDFSNDSADVDLTSWGLVVINEFIPNPEGSDAKEFIEIKNNSNFPIDLSGWQIDDGPDGSRGHEIESSIIEPGQYLIFKKEDTRIALNNNYDSVRLFNPKEELVDQVDYEEAIEGASFCLDKNNRWIWSFTQTPGRENIINTVLPEQSGDSASKKQTAISATLEEVRNFENDERVKVQGIVSVEPGILGSQIFYLAGSGIQIYMYKKDFPKMKLGDKVEVIGDLSESRGERRIKISRKEDIAVLESQEPPKPHEFELIEINEQKEGYLVTVRGELIEKRGSSFYIDDGTEEKRVYIKKATGIKKSKFNEGDLIKVTGIISQTKTGYRILPRYPDDIIIEKSAKEEEVKKDDLLMANNKARQIITYLTITAAALFMMLVGLIVKYKFIKKKE